MPEDLAYGDLLEKARLGEKGRALGLNDPSAFETYIMNFEIHRMLGRALGGVCSWWNGRPVPFGAPASAAQQGRRFVFI